MTTIAHRIDTSTLAQMVRAPERVRDTAITAGAVHAAFLRITRSERAELALSVIHSDFDAQAYAGWSRVGTALGLILRLPAVLAVLGFIVAPSVAMLLLAAVMVAVDYAVERHQYRTAKVSVARRRTAPPRDQ